MARAPGFGFVRSLPNASSVHQTPASLMIDSHYAQLQIVERWDWNRYVRLCQFLRMTAYEVASLVMLGHGAVETFHRTGRLSGSGHRAVGLVLTLLEAHVLAKWTDDVIANPFPRNLGTESTEDGPEDTEKTARRELLRERFKSVRAARGRGKTCPSSLNC